MLHPKSITQMEATETSPDLCNCAEAELSCHNMKVASSIPAFPFPSSHSPQTHVRLIGGSELAAGVNVNLDGCVDVHLHRPFHKLVTCPGWNSACCGCSFFYVCTYVCMSVCEVKVDVEVNSYSIYSSNTHLS